MFPRKKKTFQSEIGKNLLQPTKYKYNILMTGRQAGR
jgi:hypothetical protein